MIKKYQVFVSSTYEDLKEERKAISQALLESDCIPAGMELFPASNKKSWEIIKKVIDDSDYFLVVLAGKYGSTKKIGKTIISYTEMEFNYAQKMHKPIIAFIHNNIPNLISSKVEDNDKKRQLLEKFKKKILNTHIQVSFWNNSGELISAIKTSLQKVVKNDPSSGWIKCSDLGIMGTTSDLATIDNLLIRWGLDRIFRTRAEKNAESDPILEKHNVKELDGIAFGLRSFRTTREKDILNCLILGAKVRLLVMDPNSSFVVQRALEEKEPPKSISKSINDLVIWANKLNQKSKLGKIEIKFYHAMTLDFYWRIDDIIYVGPYWYNTGSQQTITYKFKKPGRGFELYSTYFEELWNNDELTFYPKKLDLS